MEAVKKYWFWGIFISILSIFAMSHNASAIDFTLNLDNYEQVYNNGGVGTRYKYRLNAGSEVSPSDCAICLPTGIGEISITSLMPAAGFNFKKNDIAYFDLLIWTKQNYSISNVVKLLNFSNPIDSSNYYVIGYDDVSTDFELDIDSFYTNNPDFFNLIDGFNITAKHQGYKVIRVYFRLIKDFNNGTIGINASSGIFSFYSIENEVNFRLTSFTVYRFMGSEENREVEEKTQDAVDDSQAAGGDSSQDAQTGTTGLLNAITGAVSVISSASPTNCKINGNMGNLNMGQLDLCANPAPAFIQTIGSLILILMCVPLAISLFNRFIAIFRSFQS